MDSRLAPTGLSPCIIESFPVRLLLNRALRVEVVALVMMTNRSATACDLVYVLIDKSGGVYSDRLW